MAGKAWRTGIADRVDKIRKRNKHEIYIVECKRTESLHAERLLRFFKEIDADIFCLQETKLQEGQIDLELPGYHQYWNYAEKKGYSGTAILPRRNPCR